MIFKYIEKACDNIEDYFLKSFDRENIDIKSINIQRTNAFMIQSFGRVLKKTFKKNDLDNVSFKTHAESIKTSGKFIEDAIGDYLYHFEMKDFSDNESKLKGSVDRLSLNIKLFQKHTDSIRKAFSELSKKSSLRECYLKGCVREFKSIRKYIKIIEPELLEDGTHELRRKLRWVIMHIIYPKGLFSYKEENPDVNKYTRLAPNKEFKPVSISFEALNFLSASVYTLGKIKDTGLSKNYNKDHSLINESDPKTIEVTAQVLEALSYEKHIKRLIKEIKKSL